ncbi:MAG: hypothetical protein ACRD21_09825 [Vicinamibacteria bacterium]
MKLEEIRQDVTWGARSLGPVLPEDLYRVGEVRLDSGILSFSVLVTLATPLLFGLAPAIRASRRDLASALKAGGRTGAGFGLVIGLVPRCGVGQGHGLASLWRRTVRPVTFAGVILVFLVTAILASLVPASRAARGDPISALRHD